MAVMGGCWIVRGEWGDGYDDVALHAHTQLQHQSSFQVVLGIMKASPKVKANESRFFEKQKSKNWQFVIFQKTKVKTSNF